MPPDGSSPQSSGDAEAGKERNHCEGPVIPSVSNQYVFSKVYETAMVSINCICAPPPPKKKTTHKKKKKKKKKLLLKMCSFSWRKTYCDIYYKLDICNAGYSMFKTWQDSVILQYTVSMADSGQEALAMITHTLSILPPTLYTHQVNNSWSFFES